MSKASSFAFGFLFALLGAVVGGQVTKFPAAAGAGASYDQDLNTTDSPTFADVTLTDDLILGSNSIIHTPDAANPHVLQMEAGDASASGQGGTVGIYAGSSVEGEGGNASVLGGDGLLTGGEALLISGTVTGTPGYNAVLRLSGPFDIDGAGGSTNVSSGKFTLDAGESTGTNIAGTDSELHAAKGTGNGVPGAILMFAAPPGASGTTVGTEAEVFRIDHLGAMFSKVYTAAPAAGDCNDAAETGRFAYDSTGDNLYICSGASGWRKIVTTTP